MPPSLLITGGSGFIGTHLLRVLVRGGASVVDFSHTLPPPAARVFLGADDERVKRIEGDVRDREVIGAVMLGNAVDVVVHTAAVNGENAALSDPARAIDINVAGTVAVASAAAECGVGRLVYVGSATQYGPREDLSPIDETVRPSPSGIYAASKQGGEAAGLAIARAAGIEFVSLRVSAPYGPLETIVPTPMHVRYWCDAVLRGRPLHLDCGGAHRRDLTHVSDIARAIAHVALAPRIAATIYNVSSGVQVTIGEVVRTLRAIRPTAKISVGPGLLAADDPRVRLSPRGPLAVDRLCRDFRWSPSVSLAQGVTDYMAWLEAAEHIGPDLSE